MLRKATPDQLQEWGRQSGRAREIVRLQQELPMYRPMSRQFAGFVIACSFQLQRPVIHTIQLYDTGRYDSFRSVVDGDKQIGRAGWYGQLENVARLMPRRIIQE